MITPAPLPERFWPKAQRGGAEECWPWMSVRNNNGYGTFSMACPDGKRRMRLAHRMAWEITHAITLRRGECVLHRCDNPRCVNPNHLFIGTQGDNVRDAIVKGRMPVGEQSGQAKLTAQNVRDIREQHRTGLTRSDIARRFGVVPQTISKIVAGAIWRSVV